MGMKLVDSYRIEQEKEIEMKRRFEAKRILLKAGPRSLNQIQEDFNEVDKTKDKVQLDDPEYIAYKQKMAEADKSLKSQTNLTNESAVNLFTGLNKSNGNLQ